MGKLIDLTGKQFGRWKVLKRAPNKISPQGKSITMWYCMCDCGNSKIFSITGNSLKQGNTKSCGCLASERLSVRSIGNTYSQKEFNYYEVKGDIVKIYNEDRTLYFLLNECNLDKIKTYHWFYDRYWYTCIKNKKIPLHNVLLQTTGKEVVDHIDRNPHNNLLSNLRVVTPQQNSINRSLMSNNHSGVTGVRYDRQRKCYEAFLSINGKRVFKKRFKSKSEAIKARLEAEIKYFGEFSPQQYLFKQYQN